MDDKKGGLGKEFTINRGDSMKVTASPSPSERRGCTDWVLVGSLLLVACTRSLDGGDVPGGDLMLGVGIMKRGRKMDQSLMFNARSSEG